MKGVERQWQNFWSRKRCEEAGMTGEAECGKVKEPGMEMSRSIHHFGADKTTIRWIVIEICKGICKDINGAYRILPNDFSSSSEMMNPNDFDDPVTFRPVSL